MKTIYVWVIRSKEKKYNSSIIQFGEIKKMVGKMTK